MPDQTRTPTDHVPMQALATVQSKGAAFSTWLGCAMADYMRRTANDMAGFARDKAVRDAQLLARAATCRDPAQLAQLQHDYLGQTVAAATDEAGRQAEKTARFCAHVVDRMAPAGSAGS